MTERRPHPAGQLPSKILSRPGVSAVNRDTRLFGEFIARDRPRTFLDVGTGSGYLAIRLALGGSDVLATDLSPAAVELARRNAALNGVELRIKRSDLFDGVEGTFDAIAFNPPFSSGTDGRVVAVIKQAVRRIKPLERALMLHMPPDVRSFRRRLIRRFLHEGAPHLSRAGAFYLLLYSQEVAETEGSLPEWTSRRHSPPPLEARNLMFLRLSR